MRNWTKRVHRVEDALLVILLTGMILLASTQILLRNLFDSGFVWADPLLRVMVLWLGMIGATVATRDNKHIRIDLLSRYFERNTHRLIQSVIGQISAWTCLVVAWYGMNWVWLDYREGLEAVIGAPAWLLEIVIPLSFTLIGIRYFYMSICWAQLYLRHRKVAARADQ